MNEEELTEEELRAAARRSMAYNLLPSIIRTSSELLGKTTGAKLIVKKAYQFADEMLKQGE